MKLSDSDAALLLDVSERIRAETLSAFEVSLMARFSPASVRRIFQEVRENLSKLDRETIDAAFDDLGESYEPHR